MGQRLSQHPRGAVSPRGPDGRCLQHHAQGSARFFVAGDIGEAGPGREAVAAAMARLQAAWLQAGEPGAAFVVGTGDQVYHGASDAAFEVLEREVLCRLPLPWVLCLGNHDVKGNWAGWHWHHARHGRERGWRWICPAPAFSLDAVCPGLGGPVDLVVVNTNKYRKMTALNPPAPGAYLHADGAPAAPFFTSSTHTWWREQKRALEEHLQAGGPLPSAGGRWRVVVGHHPCEYAEERGWKEWASHHVPLVRSYATTFMRGGPRARRHRWGLAHVIRRGADLYLCGHQHLMAHLSLLGTRKRSSAETRCHFAVVGCSSKIEQDAGDFEDGDGRSPDGGNSSADESGEGAVARPPVRSPTVATTNKRYSDEWICVDRLGFAVVDASASARCCTVTFYALSHDRATAEAVHSVRLPDFSSGE